MPERVVQNDELLHEFMEMSDPYFHNGDKEQVMLKIKALFRISGTKERRLREKGERAYDYTKKAVNTALERASLKPTDIDLLLYVGVGRGWIEPGMAPYFLEEFGMTKATGFDLLDACLSWMRALHISHNFLKNGVYKNIMILNSEFNQEYKGPFKSPEVVPYRFAQLTIGESSTATILSSSTNGHAEPYFEFVTDATRHDLCKIPLPNIASYNNSEKCPELDPLVFFAYSADLFNAANEMIPELYLNSDVLPKLPCDIAFAHSASKSIIDNLARRLNLEDQIVNLYPKFGNTVSASIPTAMWDSIENGRLKRGMDMKLFMGSAGFSAGICHMQY